MAGQILMDFIRFSLKLACPLLLALLYYYVYDFSLRSYVSFSVYTLSSLAVFIAAVFFSGLKKNKKSLIAVLLYLFTYLSVYLIALGLNLNTNLIDVIKGIDFSLISLSFVITTESLLGLKKCQFSHVKGTAFVIIVILSLLLPLIFESYFVATSSLLSSDIIIALAQTNAQEGAEFFLSNVNIRWGMAFLFFMTILLLNIYAFKRVDLSLKVSKSTAFSLLFCLISAVFLALPRMDYLPFSVVNVTSKQLDNFNKYKELKSIRAQKLSTLTDLSLSKELRDDPGLYIVVVGESNNASRMSVFGAKRNTFPLLNNRVLNKEALIYKNVYSSWPQTVQALSYALTQANQYQNIDVVDSFSIIEIAKSLGFETYWLSNQRKFGMYETPITVIASTADHEIWTNGSSKMEGVFYDYELVKRFRQIKTDKKTLVIVHLMGSHQKYDRRVPNKYKTFKSGDSVIDSYDDTLLYTDYVVDSIYSEAKKNQNFRAMLYFSDHGEDPYLMGGHDPENVTEDMLHVPMVVYLSESYTKLVPEKAMKFKDRQNDYFSNDLVFNLMISMLGIEGVPGFENKLDLLAEEYDINADSLKVMYGKNTLKSINAKK